MKNWIAACVLLFAATGLVAQQSNAGGGGGGGGAVTQSGTWNVQIQDASANGITSNSTTFTAKRGLDINLLGTAGTAFTTPGFVDIKGADGNIFVRQAIGSNLHMVCDSGCASGGASTPADTFSNPTTAGLSIGFGAVWNGTTWDRQYGDKTNGAFVNIKNSITLPVSGTFWQTTQPVSIASMPSTPVTGTFWQATQPVSGTVTVTQATGTNLHTVVDSAPTTAVTGTFFQSTQPVSIADGSSVTLGAKGDAKNTATDTTAISLMSVMKEISALEQAPASRAVTNAGTFAVQATLSAGSAVIGHVIADSGSTTAVTGTVQTSPINSSVSNTSDAAWTSATSLNTAATLISNVSSYASIRVTLVQGTTITGGVVTFEDSVDNTTYTTVQGVQQGTTTVVGPTYTLTASTNVTFIFPVTAPYFRVRLSTAITGTGTVTVQHVSQVFPMAALIAGTETLAAGTNVIGHVIADSGSTTAVTGTVSSNTAQVNGSTVVTAATGVQKVGIVGNTGATVDAAIGGAASTNAIWDMASPSTASAASTTLGNAAALTVLNIKASAGNVYGVTVVNKAATVIYLQFYNTAGTPTLGTSVISWIPIAASATLVIPPGSYALSNFATGIGIGASTTATSTGTPTTAPDVTVWYK